MKQDQTESKPQDVEEPREKGLDETPCSSSFEGQHRVDSKGLVIDPATGKAVALMVAIHGATRSICKECGQPITATKAGSWVHSDGRLMLHEPSPKVIFG